eukprot:CAMPEP_0175040392 /NCGR_PEP_ID=MMETSP0052_2-20121109/1235_1 /TAXON_ID=51329 ORGANISM="Polytomella parva, Strain SAG 63-3" /NCGR_SAMPLE_ID=MMETSP0052_2 /ASSEMBLY_ACC=CAM_ASM_000194 /LENGTH=246 /DNA_ID=CAMNT_0016302593 /DNA_START=80 /DNA_END=817 /DNA_ORIENTATION=+
MVKNVVHNCSNEVVEAEIQPDLLLALKLRAYALKEAYGNVIGNDVKQSEFKNPIFKISDSAQNTNENVTEVNAKLAKEGIGLVDSHNEASQLLGKDKNDFKTLNYKLRLPKSHSRSRRYARSSSKTNFLDSLKDEIISLDLDDHHKRFLKTLKLRSDENIKDPAILKSSLRGSQHHFLSNDAFEPDPLVINRANASALTPSRSGRSITPFNRHHHSIFRIDASPRQACAPPFSLCPSLRKRRLSDS